MRLLRSNWTSVVVDKTQVIQRPTRGDATVGLQATTVPADRSRAQTSDRTQWESQQTGHTESSRSWPSEADDVFDRRSPEETADIITGNFLRKRTVHGIKTRPAKPLSCNDVSVTSLARRRLAADTGRRLQGKSAQQPQRQRMLVRRGTI